MKMNVIKQLFEDVNWGDLDYMVIDCPPGTGDEPLSVVQLIPEPSGAVIVTTPQEISLSDVRRSIQFCHALKLPVLGVIENMSGFVCPHCGQPIDLFGGGNGAALADQHGVGFLGSLPIDPQAPADGDTGQLIVRDRPESPVGKEIIAFAERLLQVEVAE